MLLRLFIILIVISTITTDQFSELLDLPLKIEGDIFIQANLIDSFRKETYSIKEWISTHDSTITGKIVVSNHEDSYDIHYKFDKSGRDSKTRLVIHGNECKLYSEMYHEMTENANLFGKNQPLRNLLLLMGPSIVYRLAGHPFVYTEAEPKKIRGINMKGATTSIHKTLKITTYYKDKYDVDFGVGNPTRLEIDGYESSKSSREKLFLDIYLQYSYGSNQIDDLKYKVQPSTGIGCSYSLSETKSLPELLTKYIKFTMVEDIQGSINTRSFSEITASGQNLLMRLKTTLLGVKTEVIYDNGLGIILTLEEGGHCKISMGDKNSPGLNSKGFFKLNNLLLVDGNFIYLGKSKLEDQLPIDVWESVQNNVNFEGNKVDKLVITQYFVSSPNDAIFDGYSLVRTMISIYNLDSSKKSYTLTTRIKRDYRSFQTAEFEYELYDYFTLKDCKYLISDKKVTLNFKLACEDYDSACIKFADKRFYEFREEFKNEMILYEPISPLRLDDIQYRSTDSDIEFDVTFLDKPDFLDIIKPENMLVSSETLKKAKKRSASNERECLESLGHVYGFFVVGIYRPSDSFCGYLKEFEDFKEDTKSGQSCNVYIFPLQNYYHISHEVSLDNLQKSFLEDKFRTFSLKDTESGVSYSYKILDIINVTEFQKGNDASVTNSFYRLTTDEKIKSDDMATLVIPGISTFADCLRICQNSEQLICNTFSFCSAPDSVDCRVSSLTEANFTSVMDTTNKEHDSKCAIFSMNAFELYSEVPKRKFKNQASTSIRKSQSSCAQMCSSSDDCISFQYCGYSCSFNSFYTDSNTEYDEECSIFYPKSSHEYRRTGNIIVSEVIHTEMNMNLDQCASLCHGWSDGETRCTSFNYCPRNIDNVKSSCSLTKYSVKSFGTNTTEGGHCSNYELMAQSNENNRNEQENETEVIKGTSGSGAFGIIMIFLFTGALLGFSAPFAYEKMKRKRSAPQLNESFSWTRQVDDKP